MRDQYPDIAVTSEDNPTGKLRYFYSTGLTQQGQITYANILSGEGSASQNVSEAVAETIQQAQSASGDAERTRQIDDAQRQLDKIRTDDVDTDGIPDELDDIISADGEIGKTLGKIADNLEDTISSLKCDAGCIPMPLNVAFLSPGLFQVLGFPIGYDPGVAAIASPIAVPPFVDFFGAPMPYYTPPGNTTNFGSVSPAYGGVGTGICLGLMLPVPGGISIVLPCIRCNFVFPAARATSFARENALANANSAISISIGRGYQFDRAKIEAFSRRHRSREL